MKKTPERYSVFAIALTAMFTMTSQAVVVNFGETVPTTNIITSYDPAAQDGLSWFNSTDPDLTGGYRIVAQSFIAPAEGLFTMDAISMKLKFGIASSFPEPSDFSIDFYKLTGPGENPASGVFVDTQTGQMQPTTSQATAGSFLTFQLDTPIALEAGTSYGYVLTFTGPAAIYNFLGLASGDGAGALDPAGTRAWINQGGTGWQYPGTTYVYYIQGTAIPEPSTIALGALSLAGFAWLRHARRRSA